MLEFGISQAALWIAGFVEFLKEHRDAWLPLNFKVSDHFSTSIKCAARWNKPLKFKEEFTQKWKSLTLL